MYRRDLRDLEFDALLADMATADLVMQAYPSPDGDRLAYAQMREHRLSLWLTDGESATRLTGDDALVMARGRNDPQWVDWSPDGERLAYVSGSAGSQDVWTVNVETGEKTRVTSHDGADSLPRWSPDGERIAFATDLFSPSALAVADADGSSITCLADDEYLYADPQWADDETVYATRTRHADLADYEAEVVRATLDGALDVAFSREDVRAASPRPRPGSDDVAFVHDATGFDAVYTLTDPDDPLHVVENAEVGTPAWHASGDRFATTVTADAVVQVHEVDAASGDSDVLTEGEAMRLPPTYAGDDVIGVETDPTTPQHARNYSTGERLAGSPPAGLAERLVDVSSITYESTGGVDVHALVFLPDGVADAEPDSVPLLVHPHGGPTVFDGYSYDFRAQYFAALGYAVVEPNYRGSDGYGREWRNANDHAWGAGDLDDVVNAADALADAYPAVDGERAGIYGGSGGGLMTVNALGRTDRFLAGAAFYGVYDYESFVNDTDDVGFRLMKRELGSLARDLDNYRAESPIAYADDIESPLLLLHGEEDVRVPISQSEQLAERLDRNGIDYEFQRYDDEPHGFRQRENVLDAYTRCADLFAKYLQLDPDRGTSHPHHG